MGHEAYLYRFRLCDVLSTDTELKGSMDGYLIRDLLSSFLLN